MFVLKNICAERTALYCNIQYFIDNFRVFNLLILKRHHSDVDSRNRNNLQKKCFEMIHSERCISFNKAPMPPRLLAKYSLCVDLYSDITFQYLLLSQMFITTGEMKRCHGPICQQWMKLSP